MHITSSWCHIIDRISPYWSCLLIWGICLAYESIYTLRIFSLISPQTKTLSRWYFLLIGISISDLTKTHFCILKELSILKPVNFISWRSLFQTWNKTKKWPYFEAPNFHTVCLVSNQVFITLNILVWPYFLIWQTATPLKTVKSNII